MTDQQLVVSAMRQVGLIVAEHLELGMQDADEVITQLGMAAKIHSTTKPKRAIPQDSVQQLAIQYSELRQLREAVRKAELAAKTVRARTDVRREAYVTTH